MNIFSERVQFKRKVGLTIGVKFVESFGNLPSLENKTRKKWSVTCAARLTGSHAGRALTYGEKNQYQPVIF